MISLKNFYINDSNIFGCELETHKFLSKNAKFERMK
jgi:hypothetical protein